MGVVAMQFVLAGFPAAVVADVRAAFWIVEELVGRAPEVLLAVCVVALRPVVDSGVANWAERGLVAVKHEFVVGEHTLKVFQVVSEALFTHQSAH